MSSPLLTLTSDRRCSRVAARLMDAIAERHGARMIEVDSPTYRRWWEIPAGATAHQTEAAIRSDLQAAGIIAE